MSATDRQPHAPNREQGDDLVESIVRERVAYYNIVFFGLSAVRVAATAQAMSIEHPDKPVLVAMFCFSLSLPLTVAGGMISAAKIDFDTFSFRTGEPRPEFLAPLILRANLLLVLAE